VNPIPQELDFDQASMSEIVACCLNAHRNSPVHEGDVVLIFGAGPAGMIHAQLAHLSGASKVLMTQRSTYRLELAQARFPVDCTIASLDEDLRQVVLDETDGLGADVIFVAAPSRQAQETALGLIANRGRVNFFGGLPKDDCIVHVNANDLHYREFFVAGASSSLPETNREALHLLAERKLDPDALITHRFPLSEIRAAFDVVEDRQCIKVVINP
jgi:L-iditol 2-dehydrogenase